MKRKQSLRARAPARILLSAALACGPVLGAGGPTPAWAQAAAGAERDAAGAEAGTRVPYTLALEVTDPVAGVDLVGLIEAASTLRRLEQDPPATRLGLRRRMESDVAAARAVLRAQGFYAGTVRGSLGEGVPVRVTLTVTPGPRYAIAGTEVVYRDRATDTIALPLTLARVGLAEGDPARADAVLAAERDLVQRLRHEGRPFAEAVNRRVAVNHARRSMSVRIAVQAGPPTTFGGVRYEGLERLKADYLEDMVPWRAGARFDTRQLDRFRNSILTTRLFDSVTVRPADAPEEDGSLSVIVTVEEAPARSIGGGLRYSTDDGPGGRLFWEHRNLFGRAETLRFNLDAALTAQTLEASFSRPRFLHPDQSLSLSAVVERADRDAYTGLTAEVGASVERTISDTWRASAGVLVDYSILDDAFGDRETSLLVGLPISLARDDTDDPLNPTEGSRLSVSVTPYAGQSADSAQTFAVVDVTGSTYYAPLEGDRLVLAGRARLASLFGAETAAVPANKRLFAGGGGSVRGYGHQMVGPLDSGGDPLGGRSAVEVGLEARIKVTDSIGIVPFLDAGMVTDAAVPDFSEDILYAAGLGARYYTDFGPLRLDIGVPLNPRDADDFLQVYISLGQAF